MIQIPFSERLPQSDVDRDGSYRWATSPGYREIPAPRVSCVTSPPSAVIT